MVVVVAADNVVVASVCLLPVCCRHRCTRNVEHVLATLALKEKDGTAADGPRAFSCHVWYRRSH